MRKEVVRQGTFLLLLSDYLCIPAGTLATVDGLGVLSNGEFFFTVRWLNPPSETRSRPVSDRSLNLWESDLEMFEMVSREEAEAALSACRPLHSGKVPAVLRLRESPRQLRLFED
jgi:hypothetical protein